MRACVYHVSFEYFVDYVIFEETYFYQQNSVWSDNKGEWGRSSYTWISQDVHILLSANNQAIRSIEMLSLIYLLTIFLLSQLQGFYRIHKGILIIFALICFWQDLLFLEISDVNKICLLQNKLQFSKKKGTQRIIDPWLFWNCLVSTNFLHGLVYSVFRPHIHIFIFL